jgi:hypothetical protein
MVRAGLEQQVRSDLEAVLRHAAGSASSLRATDLKARFEEPAHSPEALMAGGVELMLVDANWRLIGPETAGRPGSVIVWIPSSRTVHSPHEPREGHLAVATGYHRAMASLLSDGGYLVAHVPDAWLDARQAQLTGTLPWLTLLTLVWTCVPLGIVVYMIVRRCQERLDGDRQSAQAEALRQTYELVRTRDAIIVGLAKLAESRDSETGDHLERMAAYSTILAGALAGHPKFRDQITPTFIRLIGSSSVLHDIGKVGVPDSILLKQGPLTESERALMQQHSSIGGRCLREIERRMGTSSYLQMAREIALRHHERWDGSGYPDGLASEEIPLAARIVALADVYDALSTRRSYKEPFPHEKCVAIIREERGRQFDPDIVDVWLTIEEQCRKIAERYAPSCAGTESDPQTGGSQEELVAAEAGAE